MIYQVENKIDLSWAMERYDDHIRMVEKIGQNLASRFPRCGIGISGSVGRLEHKPTSDIDLLVVDNSFKRNRQCVLFEKQSIKVNAFCLAPALIDKRFNEWMLRFNGQHINYFSSTKIIYDPLSLLANLKNRAKDSTKLILSPNRDLRQKCIEAVKRFEFVRNDKEGKLNNVYRFTAIMNTWFINNGIKLKTKKEHKNSFELIKKKDEKFYGMIKVIIEEKYKDNNRLLKAWEHVKNI